MEWQFWLYFTCLLTIGALCRVGVFLNCFAGGACAALFWSLGGAALENQLTVFLLVSLIGIIIARLCRKWGFDKSLQDRL